LRTALRILLSVAAAALLLWLLMGWGEVRPADVLRAFARVPLGVLGAR
jgi:hypothetical protein